MLPGPDAAKYGAFHTSEVPYVLNTLSMSDRPFTDVDCRIADTLSSVLGQLRHRRAIRTARDSRPGPPSMARAGRRWSSAKSHAIPVAGSIEKREFFGRALGRR